MAGSFPNASSPAPSPGGGQPGAEVVWEQRWHPLRLEWVIVAAHRQARPWSGQTVGAPQAGVPSYVPDCYLCPGNPRVGGARNPAYHSTFVFDNDLPCVGPAAPVELASPPPPYRNRRADGLARVVCYSPLHNLTLAEMPVPAIAEVVAVWQQQTRDLGARPEVQHVLCFENKGQVGGVSNPHPHGQIYATNFVFKTIETELAAGAEHRRQTGRSLMMDIFAAEQQDGRRILYEDEHTLAFVPYFARYAYEVYVVPRRAVRHIYDLSTDEALSLAHALKDVTVRFDNLWRTSFPYVMALHQAPAKSDTAVDYHFFISFHPPLRTPTLLKYLAGPEIGGGNFLSDTSPEATAAELRAQPTVHFRAAQEMG